MAKALVLYDVLRHTALQQQGINVLPVRLVHITATIVQIKDTLFDSINNSDEYVLILEEITNKRTIQLDERFSLLNELVIDL
jgi:hypothetical protein